MASLTLYSYERHDAEVIDPTTLLARSCAVLYENEGYTEVRSKYGWCGFGDLPVLYYQNQVIAKEQIVEFFKSAYDINSDLNPADLSKSDLLEDICKAKLHPALMYSMWIEKDTPKTFFTPPGSLVWRLASLPYYKVRFN